MSEEPKGCLLAIIELLSGKRPERGEGHPSTTHVVEMPYEQAEFVSPAERSLLGVLDKLAGSRYRVVVKPRLGDVFKVVGNNRGAFNRISSKHVDFLFCRADTLKPVVGIELDDKSHARESVQKRDAFVADVFAAAKLPLLRIPASDSYDPKLLAKQIVEAEKREKS